MKRWQETSPQPGPSRCSPRHRSQSPHHCHSPWRVSPPPCRLRSPRWASPRPLRWPSPPPLEFEGPNRELRITTIPGEDEWPDASQVRPIALAHIPLSATWQTRLNEQAAYVLTAQRARQITEANSYEELWPIFATRASTVPEAFTRMYLSEGRATTASYF